MLLSGSANVRLHEVGLGREDAELSFGLIEDGNDGSGSFVSGKGGKTLPVRKGDRFIAAHEPDLASGAKRIGFVKCDVESFEAEVFGGLRMTLSQHKPLVTFESNRKAAGEEAWAELRAAGYDTLHVLRETGDDSSKIIQEVKRLAGGYTAWLETRPSIPDRRCNLVASVGRID